MGSVERDVAAAVGLAEGAAGVGAVIATLARLEPVSTRRISRAVELPVPIVAAVCGELRKRGLVAEARPARLTTAGRERFSRGAVRLPRTGPCPACAGRTLARSAELAPVVRELARAARTAPPVRLELDQCHCTVETKLRRVLAIHDADALVSRKILLLGDDDLISVAIGSVVSHLGSGSTVAQLTVLDLDPDVVAFLRGELAEAPFPVSCLRHDLRQPLPVELRGAFDTVVTDPPYTLEAARLFLSRAAEAAAGAGASVFLSFGSRRPEASFRLQQTILGLGFAIRSVSRDFNEYVGAGVLGGTSHLYELAATRELRPPGAGAAFGGPLYTSEVARPWVRAAQALTR